MTDEEFKMIETIYKLGGLDHPENHKGWEDKNKNGHVELHNGDLILLDSGWEFYEEKMNIDYGQISQC